MLQKCLSNTRGVIRKETNHCKQFGSLRWQLYYIQPFPFPQQPSVCTAEQGNLSAFLCCCIYESTNLRFTAVPTNFVQLQGKDAITLTQRITKAGEVIQTFNIKLVQVLWWDEQTAAHHNSLD